MVQLVSTILKILPLILVSILGIIFFDIDNFTPFNVSGESNFTAIISSSALALWAFMGLESATIPYTKVKNPKKNIPIATILGTVIAFVIYIFCCTGVMVIISPDILAKSSAPFADAVSNILGEKFGYFVAACSVIACLGTLNGWILMQGQIPLAASNDKIFPSYFKKLSKNGSPIFGIIFSSILATVLMLTNYTKSLINMFTFIIMLATLTALVPYLFTSLSEILILYKSDNKITLKKIIKPLIIGLLAFVFLIFAIIGLGAEIVYWGFILLICGIPVYVLIKWQNKNN